MLKIGIIAIVFLIGINFKLAFRIGFKIDVINKAINFTLGIFSKKIYEAILTYESSENSLGKLILHRGVKQRNIELFNNGESDGRKDAKISMLKIIKKIFSRLMITKLDVKAKIGSTEAFKAAMMMGSTKIAFHAAISYLKSRQDFDVTEEFISNYNEDVFIIEVYSILNISIADIIFVLFYNFFLLLRKKKNSSKKGAKYDN